MELGEAKQYLLTVVYVTLINLAVNAAPLEYKY